MSKKVKSRGLLTDYRLTTGFVLKILLFNDEIKKFPYHNTTDCSYFMLDIAIKST